MKWGRCAVGLEIGVLFIQDVEFGIHGAVGVGELFGNDDLALRWRVCGLGRLRAGVPSKR